MPGWMRFDPWLRRTQPDLFETSEVRVAAEDFGATSVLLGEVIRYREREGGEFGALRPASVWFEVQLYTAPGGERLFTARFEQTQPALSENALLAHQ